MIVIRVSKNEILKITFVYK